MDTSEKLLNKATVSLLSKTKIAHPFRLTTRLIEKSSLKTHMVPLNAD